MESKSARWKAASPDFLKRLDALVNEQCNKWIKDVPATRREDFPQQLRLALWNCEELETMEPTRQRNYAFICARNLVLNLQQREAEYQARHVSMEHLKPWEEPAAQPTEIWVTVGHWTDAFDSEALAEAVNHLPPQQYQTLELCFYEELSYAEIAEQQNRSVASIRQRHCRALKMLRHTLPPGIFTPLTSCIS